MCASFPQSEFVSESVSRAQRPNAPHSLGCSYIIYTTYPQQNETKWVRQSLFFRRGLAFSLLRFFVSQQRTVARNDILLRPAPSAVDALETYDSSSKIE